MKFFFIFIFLFCYHQLYAVESNINVISELIKNSSEEICDELAEKNITEIEVSFYEDESSILLEQVFFKTCAERNIKLLTESTNKLFLSLSEISINYKITDNKDSCKRAISISPYVKLTLNSEISIISTEKQLFIDSVEIDDLPELQESEYKFTKSKIPESKYSFYKKYLQPALITTVAVVTVVLFFTIRSN